MSKSLGNTVSPEEMIERFGADTVRLFILFAANPTAGMDWSDAALEANHRVMLQLQGMPSQLAAWGDQPTAMDGWMMARFNQRAFLNSKKPWTDLTCEERLKFRTMTSSRTSTGTYVEAVVSAASPSTCSRMDTIDFGLNPTSC